jgi:ubiquinone/menaquinone biosynthesis C-methylase UbiE
LPEYSKTHSISLIFVEAMEKQPSTFDNFDPFAKDYREIHNQSIKVTGAESQYFSEFKVKWLRDFYGNTQPQRILDLGAGDGTCLSFFSKHFPQSDLMGIDVSELSIGVAADKKIPRTEVKVYDGQHIPYPDNHFDTILVAAVMHHIRFGEHEDLMKEAMRVLKPGGRIFIAEHNPHNPVTMHIVNTCPFDKDAVLLKPAYTKKLLIKSGFQEVKNQFILFFPRGGIFKWFHPLEKGLSFLPIGGQYFCSGRKQG